MTKLKFLMLLHDKLSALDEDEVEERLNFYSEMIEDRMEEGLSEEDAVNEVGDIDEIAEQIISELSPSLESQPPVKGEEINRCKRRYKAWEIVLLIIGAPLWVSLLAGGIVIAISVYVSLWSVIISIWAAFVSLAASSIAVITGGVILVCTGYVLSGFALIGASFVAFGLSVFVFLGCKLASKGTILLTRKIVLCTKGLFTEKEVA